MQTTAKISFEVELALTGDVSAYVSATYDDPAEGGEVEDYDIEDIGIIEQVSTPSGPFAAKWKTTSILDGIDMKNPEIQKLIANLLKLREDEIIEALSEASTEDEDYE